MNAERSILDAPDGSRIVFTIATGPGPRPDPVVHYHFRRRDLALAAFQRFQRLGHDPAVAIIAPAASAGAPPRSQDVPLPALTRAAAEDAVRHVASRLVSLESREPTAHLRIRGATLILGQAVSTTARMSDGAALPALVRAAELAGEVLLVASDRFSSPLSGLVRELAAKLLGLAAWEPGVPTGDLRSPSAAAGTP